MTEKSDTKTIPITRMDCPTCIPLLEREVRQLEGVEEVRGNYMNKTLKVTFNPRRVQLEAIEAAIERVGYQIAYKKYPGILSKLKNLFARKDIDEIASLTDTDFPGQVLHASRPVVVLFSSPMCPACRIFKEQFNKMQLNATDTADFYEMDIASTETWRKYDVRSIPTVLVFRNGQLLERFDALPKIDDISQALDITIRRNE